MNSKNKYLLLAIVAISCSSSQPNVYDPRLATLLTTWGQRGVSDQSTASGVSRTPFRFRRNKSKMSTIYIDSRRRVSGSDSNFTFELPEMLHMQSGAKMAVYKVRNSAQLPGWAAAT